MKITPTISTQVITAFMSPIKHVVGHVLAKARPGEDGLDQHRAFEQRAIGKRHDGDELHADVREGVPPDRPRASKGPSPARSMMYSWFELVEHEAAGHAGDVGHRRIAQDAGRQDEMVDAVPEHFPVAGEQASISRKPVRSVDQSDL